MAIEPSDVLNMIVIECGTAWTIPKVDAFNAVGERRYFVGRLRPEYRSATSYFDRADPEVAEVIRRIKAGTVTVLYDVDNVGVISESEMRNGLWAYVVAHPFHASDDFMLLEELVRGGGFEYGTGGEPAKLRLPGVVVDEGVKTYYKREDDAAAPDVTQTGGLAGAGWTLTPPYGPHALHSMQVTPTAAGSPYVDAPRRVYRRRPDEDAAIRAIAKLFEAWWTGLESTAQSRSIEQTTRRYFTHSIGRIWAVKPLTGAVDVIYAGETTARARDARDAQDWWLGNLEQWAFDWGFPAFVVAVTPETGTSPLVAELDAHMFFHVNRDGTIGDRLENPVSGVPDATWDAWGTTEYNAARG